MKYNANSIAVILLISSITHFDCCKINLSLNDCRSSISSIADICGELNLCSSIGSFMENCSPHPKAVCELNKQLDTSNIVDFDNFILTILLKCSVLILKFVMVVPVALHQKKCMMLS